MIFRKKKKKKPFVLNLSSSEPDTKSSERDVGAPQNPPKKVQRDEWMLVPPKRIFSQKLQRKKDSNKGYTELSPAYNSDLKQTNETDWELGVGDGGTAWKRSSGKPPSKYTPSSFQRDLSISMRGNMKKPGFSESQRDRQFKKRGRDTRDDFPRDVKRRKRSRFAENESSNNDFDDLTLRALDAKMKGDMNEYRRLVSAKKRKLEQKNRDDETKKSMRDLEDETDFNYSRDHQKTVMAARDFDFDSTQVHADDVVGKKKKKRKRKKKTLGGMKSVTDRCDFCFKSKKFKKHLVVALGDYCWLGFPHFGRFMDGHCIITPYEHRSSYMHTTDVERKEISRMKHAVLQMFRDVENKDVLFMETITPMHIEKDMHFCIECIPLPFAKMSQAPSFFKKGIMDSDVKWSTHKKLIVTTGSGGKKGIMSCVPKNFPYFHVEFGDRQQGYCHVIESERKFPFRFGKMILQGMLGMDVLENKLAKRKGYEEEAGDVLEFVKKFKKYDFTYDLDK